MQRNDSRRRWDVARIGRLGAPTLFQSPPAVFLWILFAGAAVGLLKFVGF